MPTPTNTLSQSLWDHIENVNRVTSLSELSETMTRYTRCIGFSHVGFAIKLPRQRDTSSANYWQFHTIPEPYGRQRYEDTYPSDDAQQDPLIRHVRTCQPTTAFSSEGVVTHTRPDIARSAAATLRRAGDYGLKAGAVAPFWGPTMAWGFMLISTDNTCDVRDVVPTLPDFHFFAHHVHCTAQRILDCVQPIVNISERECEVLRWAAAGKTSWEVGVIINVSERTVNFHLQSAAHKLGVRGGRAACARALAMGIIAI